VIVLNIGVLGARTVAVTDRSGDTSAVDFADSMVMSIDGTEVGLVGDALEHIAKNNEPIMMNTREIFDIALVSIFHQSDR
jgi:hypothetical protein